MLVDIQALGLFTEHLVPMMRVPHLYRQIKEKTPEILTRAFSTLKGSTYSEALEMGVPNVLMGYLADLFQSGTHPNDDTAL